jgi:hypothetical protein
MKKSLHLFFGIALFASASLLAQPVLTATGCNPVAGNTQTLTNTNAISPGSAGANQTWNLGSLASTGTATTTYSNSASTPYGTTFPSANLSALAGTVYAYYKTSATAFQYYGLNATSGTKTVYSDPEDYMHYPFSYTNSYTDNVVAVTTNTSSPNPTYRRGSTTVTADGYGTVTTPVGTFGGAMRVHFAQNYQDSANFGGTPFITTYVNDEYMWYLNGNHTAIAAVFTLTTTFGGSPSTTTGGSYLNNVIAGIEEQSDQLNSASLFPNPAVNTIHISGNFTEAQKVEIKLFNTLGAQVNSTVFAEGITGTYNFKLDVSTLPEGVYFAQIHLDGNLNTTRRFVVSR